MTSAASNESVSVEIRGRVYQIHAKEDKQYIRNLAKIVDDKMLEVERGTKTVDSIRVAVLAALNLADQALKLRSHYEERIQQLENERQRLLQLLDDVSKEETPLTPA